MAKKTKKRRVSKRGVASHAGGKNRINQKLRQQADAFFKEKRYGEALPIYEKLLAANPNDMAINFNLGNVYYARLMFDQAKARFEHLYTMYPKNPDVRTYLFAVARDGGLLERMMELAEIFHREPLNESEVVLAFLAFSTVCDWPKMVALRDRCITSLLDGSAQELMLPGFCLDVLGMNDVPRETRFNLSCKTGEMLLRAQSPSPDSLDGLLVARMPSQGRLKVAYVSGDFECHPVGYFIYPIIAHHNQDLFEVFCYSGGHKKDHIADKFARVAEHFVDVSDMGVYQIAQRIKDDKIDVLVDLGGHTISTLLSVLTYRPAPVQMTYLGFASTTGVKEVDFRITDHFAEGENAQRFYTETLLTLPDCFVCFGMRPNCERATEPPVKRNGFITFGSFNNKRKLNADVIALWSNILQRVPESKLAMKTLWDGPVIDNIQASFAQHGIGPDRLTIFNWTNGYDEHVALYNQVDIALDTFPYTGTTTTCEALWMGIPVVTLVGDSHASRVSYSILKNIGFEQSIAFSEDEYLDKAVQLAANAEGLGLLRFSLQSLFDLSPVAHPEQFVPHLEALYMDACKKKELDLSGLISDDEVAALKAQKAAHPFAALPGDQRFRDVMVAEGGIADIRSMVDQCLQRSDVWQSMAVVIPAGEHQAAVAAFFKQINDSQTTREFVALTFNDDASLTRHASALVEVCGKLHWLQSQKSSPCTSMIRKEAERQQKEVQKYASRWLLLVEDMDEATQQMLHYYINVNIPEGDHAADATIAIPASENQQELLSSCQQYLSKGMEHCTKKISAQLVPADPLVDVTMFFRQTMAICGVFCVPNKETTKIQELAAKIADEMGLAPIEGNSLPIINLYHHYDDLSEEKIQLSEQRKQRMNEAKRWNKTSLHQFKSALKKNNKLFDNILISDLKNHQLTKEESLLVKDLIHDAERAIAQGEMLQYAKTAMVAMLYCAPHQFPLVSNLALFPASFIEKYVSFVLKAIGITYEFGENELYANIITDWFEEVAQHIMSAKGAAPWMFVAAQMVTTYNAIQLYMVDQSTKPFYIIRARLFEFYFQNNGMNIDYVMPLRSDREKVHIAFIVAHLHPATETYGTLSIYENLDRDYFDITLILLNNSEGELAQYCIACVDRLIVLPVGNDANKCITIMRDCNLDIAIFGTNITAVCNFASVLAMHRFARIQIQYASVTTSGFKHADYFISGSLSEPIDAQDHYTEHLELFEGPLLCYSLAGASIVPEVPDLHRCDIDSTDDAIVYVSGANFYKITPEVVDTWVRILNSVPNAILLLYPLNPNWAAEYPLLAFWNRLKNICAQHQVNSDRIRIIRCQLDRNNIFRILKCADVYLDSFPFSGATSLLDPLRVALPPVVMTGHIMRCLFAQSILYSMGLDALVSKDVEAYIQLAVSMGMSATLRQKYADKITKTMLEDPEVLDVRSYGMKVGEVYKKIAHQESITSMETSIK